MAKRSRATSTATSTSAFGVSKREAHDAAGFYRRFTAPAVSSDTAIHSGTGLDKLIRGDARSMAEVAASSVALVVTSPPYFAGKEYEEALGQDGVPATYIEYLQLLRDVFAECAAKLEPGGRIAVNVANLGRRPYRSLSADVIGILQDDLRMLLRGEIIWSKQRGASGSCAWGSFQRPGNPVLRDLTERVVIASKGRFDRAVPPRERLRRGLPSEGSMTREDFMENTVDVWEIPPDRATRVGHPAPFPVELPSRLIELYTYRGDLVLDPFVGSGTSAVAAVRTGRHYVGYDLDEAYVRSAEVRVAREREQVMAGCNAGLMSVAVPATPAGARADDDCAQTTTRDGRAAREIARQLIAITGFTDIAEDRRQPGGVEVHLTARGRDGTEWFFEVGGAFTSHRAGLRRTDVLWKALAKAAVLREAGTVPFVLLTTDLPVPGSAGARALAFLCGAGKPIHAVIRLLDPSARPALRELFEGGE